MGQQLDRQFWQHIQTFLIRYNSYNKEKGVSAVQLEEFELSFSKIFASGQLKQVIINKLATVDLKNDYHNIIMLTFFVDLSKWSLQNYQSLKADSIGPIECIINQSIQLLNKQQQFHTIVPKQNQLICALLIHPQTMNNIENYRVLYRKLKDVKQFYPAAIRQSQKQAFLKCIQESIEVASKNNCIRIVEFIFNSIFCELEVLQSNHEFVNSRLKLLKKLVRSLWLFHQDILFKSAYIIMKLSQSVLANSHLLNYVVSLYQTLQGKLIQKDSIAPLVILKHLILNNIETLIKSGGQYIILEILLTQLTRIFEDKPLKYFMRLYDWNFLEVPICQQALALLYQYTENRAHQKKHEHQIIKKHLKVINGHIRSFIHENCSKVERNEQKYKFYHLKKKEYLELIAEMNDKPKKLFKRIELITNPQIRQSSLKKYVKMIKKSSHLNNKSMIDIFSTDHHISSQLFSEYVTIFLSQSRDANLEEFIRLFTSNFFLSGQSQQIVRVIDKITQLFFVNQPENHRILRSSDAAYTFANAIIILNTDLHNPKNEEKISEESFIKMCKKINDGQDLPLELIKKTYSNIKKNKINTFRDRGNMHGISVSNWLLICSDYQANYLDYHDSELAVLDESCFYAFAQDIMTTIIDEKETAKLESLVESFLYDDNTYSCQIIEMLKRTAEKKPYLPLHILQKILELANFKNAKITDKAISYYWLATNVIECFHEHLPTNLICEFLLFNSNMRVELQDNVYLRESAEIRRIRKSIKYVEKRDAKKSIMEMFSSFLSSKGEDSDQMPKEASELQKRQNFKSLSHNILEILKKHPLHRKEAISFFIGYVKNEESKLFQEFLSCMFFIFNLIYRYPQSIAECQDLFYELLGLKQSEITKRINNLQKKDRKKYVILTNYCSFWILKILLNKHQSSLEASNEKYLLSKSLEYFGRCNKDVLLDLIKQIQHKPEVAQEIITAADHAIKKITEEKSIEFRWFYQKHMKEESLKDIAVALQKKSSKEQPALKSQPQMQPKQPILEQQSKQETTQQKISSIQVKETIQVVEPESESKKEEKIQKQEQTEQIKRQMQGEDIPVMNEDASTEKALANIENECEPFQKVQQVIIPQSNPTEEEAESQKQELQEDASKHQDHHEVDQQEQHHEDTSESVPIFLF